MVPRLQRYRVILAVSFFFAIVSGTATAAEANDDLTSATVAVADSSTTSSQTRTAVTYHFGSISGFMQLEVDNPASAKNFMRSVVQILETLLYSKEGKSKARTEGRYIDALYEKYRFIIIDSPENIKRVDDFFQGLKLPDGEHLLL